MSEVVEINGAVADRYTGRLERDSGRLVAKRRQKLETARTRRTELKHVLPDPMTLHEDVFQAQQELDESLAIHGACVLEDELSGHTPQSCLKN